MRKTWSAVSLFVVVGLIAPACGGGSAGNGGATGGTDAPAPTGMIVGGKVTDEALAAIVPEVGKVDGPKMSALTAEVAALPEADRQALLADLSVRAEVGMATASGIVDASGGEPAFVAAATDAWAPVDELVRTAVPPPAAGLRAATAPGTTDGMAGLGLFMGYMGLGMTAGSMVSGTNRMDADAVETNDEGKGMSVTASLNAVSLGLNYKGTEKNGMEVEFSAKSELQVCPAENGLLDVSGLIDVTVRKDGKVDKATVDATMRIQVGDDAEPVSKDGETRIKWSANDGSTEQSIDVTYSDKGGKQDVTINGFNWFTTTPQFARAATVLGNIIGQMVLMFLADAVEKGWKSGRCVQLDATPSAGPSGLEPGDTVTVKAEPRSKIDRSLTGGTVSAVLSGGETSIDPSATPLQAPAEFTYTAPGEKDKKGTVDFEAKSKRGIGKASITFDTNTTHWYAEYSGEVSISGEVPSLATEFTLDAEFEGGTAVFTFLPSGEQGGTFVINGGGSGAVLTGGGSYTVTDNPDGTKTLTATGNACVDVSKICRDLVHPIKLSPRT